MSRLTTGLALAGLLAGTAAQAAPRPLQFRDVRSNPERWMPSDRGALARSHPNETVEIVCMVVKPASGPTDQLDRFDGCHVIGAGAGVPELEQLAGAFQRNARPSPGVTGEISYKVIIPALR